MKTKYSRFNTGLGIGSLNTTLRFSGETEVDLSMNTMSIAGTWSLNNNWTFRSGIGRILSGSLVPENSARQDILPGTLYSVGLEYMALIGQDAVPFIHLAVLYGGSFTTVEDPLAKSSTTTDYNSSDLRFNGRATWVLNQQIFSYISSSFFAGPVNWTLNGKEVTGSDIYHYQVAMGAAYRLGSLSVFGEWSGIGEQTLAAGLSYGW